MGYDPSTGRMLQVDPYASSYASHTTYNYAVNNPVMMNDPNGGQTQAPGYGGGYVYSNAAADRLYKINNPDAYTEAWAQDFGAYTSQFDEDKPPLIPGAIRVPKDMFASIVDAVGNGGELEFNNGKIGYWKDYDYKEGEGDIAVQAKRSEFITLLGACSLCKEVIHAVNEFGKDLDVATSMVGDWLMGDGAETRFFYNDHVTENMKNAWRVSEARDFFYKKYKGAKDYKGASVTNYSGAFGIEGLFRAGLDPIEQYIGSYTVNIYASPNGQELTFSIWNNSSAKSLLYGIGPHWDRSSFEPGGNMYQYFVWTEPIKK